MSQFYLTHETSVIYHLATAATTVTWLALIPFAHPCVLLPLMCRSAALHLPSSSTEGPTLSYFF